MWRIAKIGEVTPMNTTIHNTTRISDSMVTLSIMNQCGTNESTSRHALCLDGLHSCATCPSNTPNFTLGGDVSSKCLDYGIEVGALPTIKLIVTRSQAEMCMYFPFVVYIKSTALIISQASREMRLPASLAAPRGVLERL